MTSPEVVIRQSQLEDVRAFNGLVNNSGGAVFFRATFGQFNFSNMCETSCISSIAVTEDNSTCVGYLSISDCPSIGKECGAFDNAISLIQEHVPEVSNRNALFVNFLLLDERPDFDMDSIGTELLRQAFRDSPDMDYVVWLCPGAVKLTDWTVANFVEPKSDSLKESCESKSSVDGSPLLGYRLLYAHRDNFMPKLRVRNAQIEDNDDLLPILKDSNPGVFEQQGAFFLADLVQQQDDDNRFFVGVSGNQPVGMVATSMDVNVGLITKVFDVDQYTDMFESKQKTPPPPPLVVGLMGDVRSVDDEALAKLCKENNCVLIDAEKLSLPTRAIANAEAGEESKDEAVELQVEQENAAAMHALVLSKVADAMAASPDSPPLFCVVKSYPRTDAEAEQVAKNTMLFDMVLELCSDSAAQEQEPEEVVLAHLDAVEALQNFLDIGNAPPWRKFNMQEGDEEFSDNFRELVLTRSNEIDEQVQRENDLPPAANAFAITVLATKEGYESRACDLLRVAFEEHPSLGYCMFMVPNKSEVPNRMVGSMVACRLRTGISFDQTLYILHRDSILAYDLLQVERALESGLDSMTAFLDPLGEASKPTLNACMDCYKFNDVEFKDNPMSVGFEVRLGTSIIGVITLSRKCIGNDDINWMRSNYHVDDFVNFDRHRARTQAFVTHYDISPVFGRWTRYVVREVMRKYNKTVLYFQHERDITPPREITEDFLAIAPRRRMQAGPGQELPLRMRPSTGMEADCPLAVLTKHDLTQKRTTVLNRVVIFGGGTAAWGVLQELFFQRDMYYPNVYFVSDMPLITFAKRGESTEGYSATHSGALSGEDADCPSILELYAYGFGHRVHYIQGRLTDIDRQNRAIIVSDELVVEYDQLIIAGSTKDKSFKRFPATSGMHSSYCEKRGIFGLGDPYTDSAAHAWVEKQARAKWPVVIYGGGMEVFVAVGALIELGVPSRRITVVLPSEDLPENCHPSMNEAIIRNMRSSGVLLHRGFEIDDVLLSSYGTIEAVRIKNLAEPDVDMVEIPCFSLLTCMRKFCDPDIFAAINDCGIVYDGGIVVDRDFATVDPVIYAVGDFSRFSRMYTKEPAHVHNNLYEMGVYVANRVLSQHLHCPKPEGTSALNRMPKFTQPRTFTQPMPGGKFYLNSRLPGEADDTNVLISGDARSDNMVALKLDSYGRLIEICYIGKDNVEAKNLGKLVGVHESFLNSALHSYEEGKVDDWIEWFRGEWCTALFHDRLGAMNESIRSALATDKGTYTTLDRVQDAVEASTENEKISEEWANLIGPHGSNLEPNTRRIVETSTVDYLRSNKVMLTRFALPQAKAAKKA